MTAFLWAAMALAAITHFFLSSWIAVLLTPPNATPEELATAIQIKAIFQFGAAFSFAVGWLLDKYGINAVVSVLVLAAPPVIALGFVDAGTFFAIAMSSISGILVLGGGIGLNAIAGSVYPTAVRSTGTGAAFAAARSRCCDGSGRWRTAPGCRRFGPDDLHLDGCPACSRGHRHLDDPQGDDAGDGAIARVQARDGQRPLTAAPERLNRLMADAGRVLAHEGQRDDVAR